jgi:capsular exopolysaccharide synthesis family protein
MVTSARPGEGKTSLSVQLAASLARAGRKTLFVDGDLRNPTANQVFNLPLGPGLSELLRGDADLASVIHPTSVRGLWMLPAGRWNAHATEALSREALRPILEQLKNEFDFVVVDSSPLLAVVDALLVGQQVDAILFSILHEVSHGPSVYAAYQRLETLGARILGAVVNGVASGQFGYKADYYYGGAYGGTTEPVSEESPTA